MIEIVNISGGGNLKREVDLEVLALDIDLPVVDYKDNEGWLLLRFEEDGGLVILYRTGKYILRGGNEYEKCYKTRDRFLKLCQSKGLIASPDKTHFEIKNVVCVADIGQKLDLSALAVVLGLSETEYEPEQFSGLVYRPGYGSCTMIIFHSGKVVITGNKNEHIAEKELSKFVRTIDEAGRSLA